MTASVGRTRPAVSLATTLLYTGSIGVVIACWAAFVMQAPSIATYLGLAIVTLALLALASDVKNARLGPLSLTFWAFIAVWAGIAPLYQLSLGRLPWFDVPTNELHPWAQLLTLGAAAAYRSGQVLARSSVRVSTEMKSRPRLLAGGVILPLLAFPLAAASGVSIASRFQSRDELIDAFAAQGLDYGTGGGALIGVLKTLPICITAVGVFFVLNEIVRRWRASERIGGGLWVMLLISLVAAATFANPLSNSRFQGFSALLMIGFALLSFRSVLRRALLASGLVIGLLVVYPLSAAFKNETIANRVYFRLDIFSSVDFDGFQQTVNSLWYVQNHGHTFGHHLVSALGFFIPRSVWEGKALPASYPVSESRGYTFQNLALPLWAEMYVEFGVIGMLIVFLALGIVSRKADVSFVNGGSSRLALITPVLGAVQIGVLRGPLGAQIVFAATCIFIAAMLYRRGEPDPLDQRVDHAQYRLDRA